MSLKTNIFKKFWLEIGICNGKCYFINIKFNVMKAESTQLIQKYETIKNSIFHFSFTCTQV